MEPAPLELQHAKMAGLRYVEDSMPGFRRERKGSHFAYRDAAGKPIADEAHLTRIRGLAIPPAYEHVWICPLPNGHLQATARDAKGRKQYRYHKRWRDVRDANKYGSTIAFARALPALRERVAADIVKPDASRERVLASVVRLLEATLVRIGNEGYARENGSYGLTTLRARHVRIEGERRIRLRFRGKSGVEQTVSIDDRQLARTVKRCRDLPGQTLFCYLDEAGVAQPIDSGDVNAYLREASGGDFTAKDFRTWNATLICALELEALGPASTIAEAKQNVAAAVAATAKRLGNTPAVCRKSYVHPLVIETYLDNGSLALPKTARRSRAHGLDADERRIFAFLERATARDAKLHTVALLEKSLRNARVAGRRRGQGASRSMRQPSPERT